MDDISSLQKFIVEQYDKAKMEVNYTDSEKGSTWLDVFVENRLISVEIHPSKRIGISLFPENYTFEGFGEGPDKIFENLESAKKHIAMCINIVTSSKNK